MYLKYPFRMYIHFIIKLFSVLVLQNTDTGINFCGYCTWFRN